MVKQEPILWTLFDDVKKVVGKIILTDKDIIKRKALNSLLKKISSYPDAIGVK